MKDQYQLIYCFHKIYISLQLFLQIPDHYTSLHSFVWLRSELMIKLQLTVTFCEPASVLVSRVWIVWGLRILSKRSCIFCFLFKSSCFLTTFWDRIAWCVADAIREGKYFIFSGIFVMFYPRLSLKIIALRDLIRLCTFKSVEESKSIALCVYFQTFYLPSNYKNLRKFAVSPSFISQTDNSFFSKRMNYAFTSSCLE